MSAIPQDAIDAVALRLHDETCDRDADLCGRWKAGSDPASRFHQPHVGHVEFYRERARELLEAAEAVWPHEPPKQPPKEEPDGR